MGKHTPGPWKATGKEVGTDYTATHGMVASVIGMPNNWETKANAALIAAAPDLLGACEVESEADEWSIIAEAVRVLMSVTALTVHAEREMRDTGHRLEQALTNRTSRMVSLRNAIAKATGGVS